MASEPRFRVLDSGDHDVWRAIRLEMLAAHPEAFLTTEARERATPEAQRRAQLAGRRIIGAFVAGALAGTVALLPEPVPAAAHRASLAAMYVRPAHRRAGVGRALVEEAARRARVAGCVQLELHVAEGNGAARGLYAACGFRCTGRLPRAVRVDGRCIDDLFHVRDLDG